METVIWKDIPGYEGLYQVSTDGQVMSTVRSKPKLMSTKKSVKGYPKVNLSRKGEGWKTYFVHQLMAMAFLNHKPNHMGSVVDHINEVRDDNRLSNLQILTNQENLDKAKKHKASLL